MMVWKRAAIVALVLIAIAVAPVVRLWRPARLEYPPGVVGVWQCYLDCMQLGCGLYHPPLDQVHLAPGLGTMVAPQRVDQHFYAGMGECSSIAENAQGLVQLAWMMRDPRDGQTYKVYGRQMGADGHFLGPDYRINTGPSATLLAHHVSLKVDGRGDFTVLWHAAHNAGELVRPGGGVFLRRISASGAPGAELQVSEHELGAMAEMAVGAENQVVVVWNENGRLWGRVVKADDSMTPVVRIDDGPPDSVAEYPAVAVSPTGTILVAWADTRQGGRDAAARLFNSSLEPRGGAVLLGKGPIPTVFFRLVSVVDTKVGFGVAWATPEHMMGRWLTETGAPLGDAQVLLPAAGEVALLAQPDGTALVSNGRYLTRWGADKVGAVRDLLLPPSHPSEVALAAAVDGGVWIAWHESIDAKRTPALGDNYYIMTAKINAQDIR